VRKEAHLTLENTRLQEVMASNELQREERQLASLANSGRVGKIDILHNVSLRDVSTERALVYDEYVNRSVFLDAVSRQELPTSAPESVEKVSYVMNKIDGRWKVVDGFIHD